MITRLDIDSLVIAASNAGYQANAVDLQLLTWEAGINTHLPLALPNGFSAVYIFYHLTQCFKVGQAGQNSAPRYLSHHYHTTAPSTLAKSLLRDPFYNQIIGNETPKNWIRNNTTRYNILIPQHYNKNFVNFTEAYFILKCNPRFER